MAVDEVLIEAGPGETRIALRERSRLSEVAFVRKGAESVVGNLYLGRVERILPGIQSAFIDIGLARSGFLGLAEVRPVGDGNDDKRKGIADYVREGETVMVQVLKDPLPDKGATLTTNITLPGRYVVLAPFQDGVRVSRRIGSEAERNRLVAAVEALAQTGEGFILRTAALGAEPSGLKRDVEWLRDQWRTIARAAAGGEPPTCLFQDLTPLQRLIRDDVGPGLKRLIVDDPALAKEAREFCARVAPELKAAIELHEGPDALFETYEVETEIDQALSQTVDLASGGRIVIDEAEALTAIDVNTVGRTEGSPEDTALKTNLDAAAEIGRQIRLRNIAGLIVIDFVSMRQSESTAQVLEALRQAFIEDRTPAFIAGFTRLGLVEMTRERRRASLATTVFGDCPTCRGAGRIRSAATLALDALRQARREARMTPAASLQLVASPTVVEALEGPIAPALEELESRLGRTIDLVADRGFAPDRFEVRTGPLKTPS
ncbi:MAG: Rne/Rng family ribonuclease [Rhodospirillales bacterium]|nr:Rne/Rng family ribonuclease [Rhodospirillales bacterium]